MLTLLFTWEKFTIGNFHALNLISCQHNFISFLILYCKKWCMCLIFILARYRLNFVYSKFSQYTVSYAYIYYMVINTSSSINYQQLFCGLISLFMFPSLIYLNHLRRLGYLKAVTPVASRPSVPQKSSVLHQFCSTEKHHQLDTA